jgi:hypothetical protein
VGFFTQIFGGAKQLSSYDPHSKGVNGFLFSALNNGPVLATASGGENQGLHKQRGEGSFDPSPHPG